MWFMSNEWIIGVWLYKNLNIKNHEKKWFMSKGEFGRIKKANEFLKEIENLKSSK